MAKYNGIETQTQNHIIGKQITFEIAIWYGVTGFIPQFVIFLG